jgi:hypothetical protein
MEFVASFDSALCSKNLCDLLPMKAKLPAEETGLMEGGNPDQFSSDPFNRFEDPEKVAQIEDKVDS